MEIRLKRVVIGEQVTDGELYVGRKKICDTAERTSCMLAPGKYDIVIRKNLRARKFTPFIRGRGKDFLGAMTDENGAYAFTDASILVGEYYLHGVFFREGYKFYLSIIGYRY